MFRKLLTGVNSNRHHSSAKLCFMSFSEEFCVGCKLGENGIGYTIGEDGLYSPD